MSKGPEAVPTATLQLSPRLQDLIQRAQPLVDRLESRLQGSAVLSLEDLLRRALGEETDVARLRQIGYLIGEFAQVHSAAPEQGETGDGSFAVSMDSPFDVRLTLIPPRPQGKPVPLRDIISKLKDLGVTHGVSKEALQAAGDCSSRRRETVWRLPVAAGIPAVHGEDASISFTVKAFDKRVLLNPAESFFGDLAALVEEVKAGAMVARIVAATPGSPGCDVRGNPLPATPGQPLSLGIGEGLQLLGDGKELHALVAGSLLVGEESLDIVPIHVVEGQVSVGQDIAFDGNVLVTGHVTGPVRIQARDVYIAGNAETVSVSASGDVWVGGSIHGKTRIEAEGRVFGRAVSDASVQAIGDVFVSQSIVESRVSSGGKVLLDPARGQIEGGEVSAFRGLVAHALGSTFGLPTTVRVGSGDLRAPLLGELEKKIRENEEAASKIEDLKGQTALPKGGAAQLPAHPLGLYVSLLRKEIQVLDELQMLRRRRKKFDGRQGAEAPPGMSITGPIHPPVTVEIGEVSHVIAEPLTGVQLSLGSDRKIAVRKQETPRGVRKS